jgi:hypothetical protein
MIERVVPVRVGRARYEVDITWTTIGATLTVLIERVGRAAA